MKQIIVRVPDELADDLKSAAASQGLSVNALMVAQAEAVVTASRSPRHAWKQRHRDLLISRRQPMGGGGERLVASGWGLAAAVDEDRGPR